MKFEDYGSIDLKRNEYYLIKCSNVNNIGYAICKATVKKTTRKYNIVVMLDMSTKKIIDSLDIEGILKLV